MRGWGILVLLLLGGPAARGELPAPRPTPLPAPSACFRETLDFEENLGQASPAADFLARGLGFAAFLTGEGATFAGGNGRLRMGFPGARPGPLVAEGLRPGISHYPPRVAGARRFARVRRFDLWPGVDLCWSGGAERAFEYSFLLAPGADPRRISVSFAGGTATVDAAGDLLVGGFRHGRPRAFQGGTEVPVAFLPRPDGTVGFAVGAIDPALPLVIDPQVIFSSPFGGSDSDESWAVAADPAGNLYFGGWAVSVDLPVTGAAFQKASAGNYDAFVVKRSPRGALLVYATYLGGTSADLGYAVAVDGIGRAVLAGGTQSTDFPTTAGVLKPSRASGTETGFVARLSASGAALDWSTYVGGTTRDLVRGILMRPGGDLLLVGTTSSADFPSAGAAQPALGGATDAFVADLSADGSGLAWSTFLGGTLNEEGRALGVGKDGAIFVAGTTESVDFPDRNAVKTTLTGSRDAFLAALEPDGSAVRWATYLGGDGLEEGWGLAVDGAGDPWIAGYTTSLNFPLVSAVDTLYGGQYEAFATRYAADGSAILVSTYLGGAGSDKAEAACSDAAGVVYVVGRTASTDFPVKAPVQLRNGGGDYDAFVTALAPGGTSILWSTYRGGSGSDFAMAATVDRYNAVILAGRIEGVNGDGLAAGIIAVPLPPASLAAFLTGNARVQLVWPDQGSDEDGYIVQRRTGDGPWTDVKVLGENVLKYVDSDLDYATTYSWRVIAYNAFGLSAPSPEATATTLPEPVLPPAAPTNLRVTSADTRIVGLRWDDASADEDDFVVQRFDPFIGFVTIAKVTRDNVACNDATVLPLTTYRYRVLAVNVVGPSAYSNEVQVDLGPSFDLSIVAGKRKTKASPKKDSIVLTGAVGKTGQTRWSAFNPAAKTFEVRLGADPAPLVSLPAGYAGWVEKKGKWVLRYPFSGRGKLTIVIDPAADTFVLTLLKADLLDAPAEPEEVRLDFGVDAASFPVPWAPRRKAGDYRFP